MKLLERLLPKPGPARFAKMMMRALADAGEAEPMVFDEKAFLLKIGSNHVMALRNYYDEYCAQPWSGRSAYLKKICSVDFHAELPESFADVRECLIPRIRERAYYELLPLVYGRDLGEFDPMKIPSFRPFAEHLAIAVAADYPDRISEITGEKLGEWGVTFEEALEIGRDNLWKRSVGKWGAVADGVWMSPWQDNLDVNRLALSTLFRQLEVDGDPVAFVPNRDHVIVTGSRDFVGQGAAAALANSLLDEPRPMNATPIVLDGLEWRPYEWDSSHPIAPLFKRLQMRALAEDYASQKSLLDEHHERNDIDLFVATYMAFENKEKKELRSIATWTETVDTLLPRVDAVVLNVPVGEKDCQAIGEAPWERLVEIVGCRMVRQEGMYPERYRVSSFPEREELERLGLQRS